MAKYLDYEGLKHFVGKIKSLVNGKADKKHSHSISEVTNLQAELNKKQSTLSAGSNIAIAGNTISAKDTVYDDTSVRNLISGKADKTHSHVDMIKAVGQIPFKNAEIIEKGGSTSGIPNETMIYELE